MISITKQTRCFLKGESIETEYREGPEARKKLDEGMTRPCRLSVCSGSADADHFFVRETLVGNVLRRHFKRA